MGIGTSSPGTATSTLLGVGNSSIASGNSIAVFSNAGGACYISNTGVTCSSDRRLKKNINSVTPSLQNVMQLQPVTYNFNSEDDGTQLHAGFIAQDVEALFPDLVMTTGNGMKSLNYAGLTPYLVSAIQEQQIGLERLAASLGVATSTISATSTPLTFSATSTFALALSQIFATTTPTSTPQALVNGAFADASAGLRDALLAALNALSDMSVRGVKEIGSAVHAGVGVFDKLFAKEVHTDLLCVGTTCVTQDQFLKIVAGANQTATVTTPPSTSPTPLGVPATTTPAGDTTAPVITIVGFNPTTITVGDTYIDLGATVVDPAWGTTPANNNLGLYASVDGGPIQTADMVQISTSVAGGHTIIYSATDAAGNVGHATRNIKVEVASSTPQTP